MAGLIITRSKQIQNQIDDLEKGIKSRQEKIEDLRKELLTITDISQACGKVMYRTKKEANLAKREINSIMHDRNQRTIQRTYFCGACNAYHLTSK